MYINKNYDQSNRNFVTPKLSICIATFNRSKFISETLDSILAQLDSRVEIIVVDGASPDNTKDVLEEYIYRNPQLKYYCEQVNSGVDADYDKAVGYARGQYCWLMTDDDLMAPGAIRCVLDSLESNPDVLIANSRIFNKSLTRVLSERILEFKEDQFYASSNDQFFSEVGNYLSFIGGVIVRRNLWESRDRVTYYGSVFIHVGVLFQSPPIKNIIVISEPQVYIRYGNALWSARGFEIWMFKWPLLIWGFNEFSNSAKFKVTPLEPWRSLKKILHSRAIGSYSIIEFNKFILNKPMSYSYLQSRFISQIPGSLANIICGSYCILINRKARSGAYDLARSKYSTWVSRLAARILKV